jgi:protein CpxP
MNMKIVLKRFGVPALRVAVLAMCTGMMSATALIAQDAPPPPPHMGGMHGGGMHNGPEMQKKHLEHMTKELNLSPDQVTQIKAIQDDGMVQMKALRDDTSTTGPDKHAKMMAIHETEQSKVKAALTDAQKVKFDAMTEKMKERRDEHMEHMHGPPSTPPSN